MLSTVITAFISFASTNIDDIFVLMLFFSQVDSAMKARHIIIGQYLGILALTTISIIGALGLSLIPHEYVGLLGLVPPNVFKVGSITFANGGDNIGIYIPVFTNMNLIDIIITVVMFAFLTALWCFIGIRVADHPFVHRNIQKYKHIFIPIIFIGLGFFILMENGTITFIYKKIF